MKRNIVPCVACVVLLGFSSGCLDIAFGREVVCQRSRDSDKFSTLVGALGSGTGLVVWILRKMKMLAVGAVGNRAHAVFQAPVGALCASTGAAASTAPALRADRFEVRLGSTGDLSMDGIRADSVDVRLGSTGDLSVDDLRAGSLAVRISSTGDVRLGEGGVDSLDLTISSTGDYHGESVRSTRATVALNSTGNARLWVEESLSATLNSTGSVSYTGDPEVNERSSSTGRVRPIR